VLDAFIIKKFFNLSVLEFDSIVTSYFLDRETEFLLCSSHKDLHLFLYLSLIIHKEHLGET